MARVVKPRLSMQQSGCFTGEAGGFLTIPSAAAASPATSRYGAVTRSLPLQHDVSRMTLRYGMEIRAATAAEVQGLTTLLAEAGYVIDARDLAERLAALRQGSGTALVALQWGPPSGVVVLHWYSSLEAANPVAQITMLLVSEESRRQGIGRLLLKGAAQAARTAGCSQIEIVTTSDAPSLHAFCRATGFAEAGPRFVRSLRKQA